MSCYRRIVAIIVPCLLALVAGCAEPPLPKYQWTGPDLALETMVDQLHAVHTVSAGASITMARPKVGSIHFDGALAMRLPGYLRLRTWKFGQAIFDLTLRPDGLWLESPLDPARRSQIMSAADDAGPYGGAWGLFFGGFFAREGAKVNDPSGKVFYVSRRVILAPGDKPVTMVCEVDRATLTPRKYTLLDAQGKPHFTLELERYREFPGSLVWPTRLVATSSFGVITLNMEDVELNADLPLRAFVPPRSATKKKTAVPQLVPATTNATSATTRSATQPGTSSSAIGGGASNGRRGDQSRSSPTTSEHAR